MRKEMRKAANGDLTVLDISLATCHMRIVTIVAMLQNIIHKNAR